MELAARYHLHAPRADRLAPFDERDRDLLAVLGIGFALLAITIAVITALRSWLGVYISTRLNLQLLDTLFARLLRLPLAWFEKRHIGDIVSRVPARRPRNSPESAAPSGLLTVSSSPPGGRMPHPCDVARVCRPLRTDSGRSFIHGMALA